MYNIICKIIYGIYMRNEARRSTKWISVDQNKRKSNGFKATTDDENVISTGKFNISDIHRGVWRGGGTSFGDGVNFPSWGMSHNQRLTAHVWYTAIQFLKARIPFNLLCFCCIGREIYEIQDHWNDTKVARWF